MTQVSIHNPLGRMLRAFDADGGLPAFSGFAAPVRAAGFPVDIDETDGEYRIRADLPGVRKDEVSVSVEDNVLSIGAKFAREGGGDGGENGAKRVHSERVVGEFSRGFRLSRDIEADKIGAEMKDGVLTLRLPKSGASARRSVAVK